MANISASDLRNTISGIMKGADFTTLSARKIRNLCENKFKVDLTSRKQEIDKIIMSFVDSNEDSSEEENNKPSDSSGSDQESSDSEVEDEKPPPPPPPKKVKSAPPKPKAKVVEKKVKKEKPKKLEHKQTKSEHKQTEKSEPSEESSEETDDAAVARKLQEEEWNFRRRAVKKLPKESTRKKKKIDDGKPKVRKGTSTYTRKCSLSPELAEVMEADEMARPDVVKKMWCIVRERNLLDPSNKQFAICDEQLKKVFGAKRIRMFGMMKYLKNHIKDLN